VDVKIGYLLRLAWFVSLKAHAVPCAAIYAIAIIAHVDRNPLSVYISYSGVFENTRFDRGYDGTGVLNM
jgi:hypothetical protein